MYSNETILLTHCRTLVCVANAENAVFRMDSQLKGLDVGYYHMIACTVLVLRRRRSDCVSPRYLCFLLSYTVVTLSNHPIGKFKSIALSDVVVCLVTNSSSHRCRIIHFRWAQNSAALREIIQLLNMVHYVSSCHHQSSRLQGSRISIEFDSFVVIVVTQPKSTTVRDLAVWWRCCKIITQRK